MAALTRIGVTSKTLLWRYTSPLVIRGYKKLKDGNAFDVVRQTKSPELLLHTPDPYPKTKEEIEKAAAKYNMHPNEYVPIPDDHRYCGDYPDLPWIGVEAKDPYYPWDYPHFRRNFGEPIHHKFFLMTEDRYAYGVREHVSDLQGTFIFFASIVIVVFLYSISGYTSQPRTEKQYPYSERKHYTFELVD
ncbi:NADH:ubiquinone oxidoreductase subunit ASHI [Xylocopa sonorina]|uniref:NADH:ubiquinone oxidoreductase subunit ASHI n=1 Tax=Xylocopa sonorina TaxID=1818115 RepID=UPI00403AA6E5